MNPIDLLALAVLVLLPVNLWVAIRLSLLSRRHPELPTMADRAFAACFLAIEAAIAAFFSIVRLLHDQLWPNVVTVLLIAALVIPTIPNVWWALRYFRDGFK